MLVTRSAALAAVASNADRARPRRYFIFTPHVLSPTMGDYVYQRCCWDSMTVVMILTTDRAYHVPEFGRNHNLQHTNNGIVSQASDDLFVLEIDLNSSPISGSDAIWTLPNAACTMEEHGQCLFGLGFLRLAALALRGLRSVRYRNLVPGIFILMSAWTNVSDISYSTSSPSISG